MKGFFYFSVCCLVTACATTPRTAETVALDMLAQQVYEPFVRNWEIEEELVEPDTYHISLKMKRYHTGGAGESMQALRRRALQLQREHGFSGYQILEYTEGVDSGLIGAQRIADGLIRLVRRDQGDVLGGGSSN